MAHNKFVTEASRPQEAAPTSARHPDARPLDARARKSRAALRGALLALLERVRFEDVTVRQICAEAGIGYATFFRHFADKESLLNDLAAQEIADLLAHSMKILIGGDTLASSVAMCHFVARHRALWATLLTGGAAATVKTEMIEQARELAMPGQEPLHGIPQDLAVVFATSAVVEILAWWLQFGSTIAPEEIARIIDTLAVTPVMPDEG